MLAGTRQLRLQGPVSVHAHCSERVTGSEGREGANGGVNGDSYGDGAGTRTGVEANEGTQAGNVDGEGDGAGTEMGVKTRGRTQDGDESGDGNVSSNGDGDGIGEGGLEAKKRKKPHKSCRRHVGNGRDFGGKRKKRRQERVSSVAANPYRLGRARDQHCFR